MIGRALIIGRMVKAARGNDVVDVLTSQHAEIRGAFRRAMLPWPTRKHAFGKLVRLLAVHEAAEEAHVHPTVRHISHAGRELAKARRAEEKEAKELLAALVKTGPHGDGYLTMLRKLRRAVLTHAAREEREEFPLLKRVSPLRRAMLGIEVKLTQAVAPTRPHPMVNNEIATKVAAPIFGPLDRGRDMLRRLSRGRDMLRRVTVSA